ncbi:MAG: polysaccharide biosynthesis C-terminal domain-containing protein, partial [Xanthomarina sp.]
SKEVFKKFSIISFWSLGLVMFVLVLIPGSFYVFLFGEDFVSLKSVIALLIPGTVFFGQSLITTHYFSGTGKHHINLVSNLIGMIFILSLSYLLIPNYSIVGAAAASNIGYICLFLVQFYFIRQIYKVSLIDQVYDKIWFGELRKQLIKSINYFKN